MNAWAGGMNGMDFLQWWGNVKENLELAARTPSPVVYNHARRKKLSTKGGVKKV